MLGLYFRRRQGATLGITKRYEDCVENFDFKMYRFEIIQAENLASLAVTKITARERMV